MAEQLKRGPHAVIECTEEIPCNPCCTACPQGAITMAEGLSSLPCLNRGKCTGCGLCIPCCPGQAIFVSDDTYSGSEGLLSLPYEFTPLPIVGQSVILTDRRGRPVGDHPPGAVPAGFSPNGCGDAAGAAGPAGYRPGISPHKWKGGAP